MTSFEWCPRARDYVKEKKVLSGTGKFTPTTTHPLVSDIKVSSGNFHSSNNTNEKNDASVELDELDPLSQMDADIDPLQALEEAMNDEIDFDNMNDKRKDKSKRPSEIDFDEYELYEDGNSKTTNWKRMRLKILRNFTTSEKLSITTSFVGDDDTGFVKIQTKAHDEAQQRLTDLHLDNDVKVLKGLSQQEYIRKINFLNEELIKAWKKDQRVKSLKIVIQCAKILGHLEVLPFYPSKFVLVTDIFQTFGNLVYDRIYDKACSPTNNSNSKKRINLPENFTPDMVNENARETCKNWFFKISSVRELLPRIYAELAILKCAKFFSATAIDSSLHRIGQMINGIGHPLIANYTRAYLCRIAIDHSSGSTKYLTPIMTSMLYTLPQLTDNVIVKQYTKQGLTAEKFYSLFSPVFEWVFKCAISKLPKNSLMDLLNLYKQLTKPESRFVFVLNSLLEALPPHFINKHLIGIVRMIREVNGDNKYKIYATLGAKLMECDDIQIEENLLRPLLNEAWGVITELKDPKNYLECLKIWISYVVKYFEGKEINILLGDAVKHMLVDRAFETYYSDLNDVLNTLLLGMDELALIFSLSHVMAFLDLFLGTPVHANVCTSLLLLFSKKDSTTETSDPVVVNALMNISTSLNSSINSLSLEGSQNNISRLICSFIRRVSFGHDFEQQLNFYTKARACFGNLDEVLFCLVCCVSKLIVSTHKIMKGKHSRKTAAFVRACLAFTFITIPSLENITHRLAFYNACGQLALKVQALAQADAFFKVAITLLTTLKEGEHNKVLPHIHSLIAAMIVAPDSPAVGCLYLPKGLFNALRNDDRWPENDNRIFCYISLLNALCSLGQRRLPYNITGVQSNDTLYAQDEAYLTEINDFIDIVLNEIFNHLQSLSESKTQNSDNRQYKIALIMFNVGLSNIDLTKKSAVNLVANLFKLMKKIMSKNKKTLLQQELDFFQTSKRCCLGLLNELENTTSNSNNNLRLCSSGEIVNNNSDDNSSLQLSELDAIKYLCHYVN